jgi:alpha-glucosidase
VPTTVLSAPTGAGSQPLENQLIEFLYVSNPFSFSIRRIENQEIIFNSNGSSLVFESQYLRLRTSLPDNPNLYGLGESTDPFRLPTTDYIRTIYSRDSFGIPRGTNLYGNHPVYFENRSSSNRTHGVFLLNSNGMDIMINSTGKGGQYLEYNTIGGVIDLYFLAGPGPIDVASQYSEVVGKPAMMPYWGFGFHQCRYGYNDYTEVAEVIYNYSLAGIPLETMVSQVPVVMCAFAETFLVD